MRIRHIEDSVTYQAILREGRAEGLAEGRIEGMRRFLLLLGREKLGELPIAVATIESIRDESKFEALAIRLLDVSSWDELLASP